MKTVYLDWSDTEGVSFLLRTSRLWPFEVEEITTAFVAAGYASWGVSHFVSTVQPRPDGKDMITAELEKIGYAVNHGDTESLMTVSSVLRAYSDGRITEAQAVEILHLDEEDDLAEIMKDSEVPLPRKPAVDGQKPEDD
jgi:hypothetical protein